MEATKLHLLCGILNMACDPNTLLEQAKCLDCNMTGAMYGAVEIALLCAIRDHSPTPCDPATLLTNARCLMTCIPTGMMPSVKISLLCQIAGL
jgi:hypothetical protein